MQILAAAATTAWPCAISAVSSAPGWTRVTVYGWDIGHPKLHVHVELSAERDCSGLGSGAAGVKWDGWRTLPVYPVFRCLLGRKAVSGGCWNRGFQI